MEAMKMKKEFPVAGEARNKVLFFLLLSRLFVYYLVCVGRHLMDGLWDFAWWRSSCLYLIISFDIDILLEVPELSLVSVKP